MKGGIICHCFTFSIPERIMVYKKTTKLNDYISYS